MSISNNSDHIQQQSDTISLTEHKYTESLRTWHNHQRNARVHRLIRLYGRENVLKANESQKVNTQIQNVKQFNAHEAQQEIVEITG